jgi:hypothetical protein
MEGPDLLRDLVNLKIDSGAAMLRPGLTQEFGFSSGNGLGALGMGLLRFPEKGATPESEQIVVHGTRNEINPDGSTTLRGALYVYNTGNPVGEDITPVSTIDLTSSLLNTSNAAAFAQYNNRLYGVNGVDGLLRWDGGDPDTTTALVVQGVTTPLAPVADTVVIGFPFTGSWVIPSAYSGNWAAGYTGSAVSNPFLDESNTSVSVLVPQSGSAVNEAVYYDYGADLSFDLTTPENLSDYLILCVNIVTDTTHAANQAMFENGQTYSFVFQIGNGDPSLTPSPPPNVVDEWTVTVAASGWNIIYLPLDTTVAGMNDIRWYSFYDLYCPAILGNATPDHDVWLCRPLFSGMQGIQGNNSNVFYKMAAEDGATTVVSIPTLGTEQQETSLVLPSSGPLPSGTILPQPPTGKVQVTVDFGTQPSTVDILNIYRAVIDPSTDLTPEGKTYYFVAEINRSTGMLTDGAGNTSAIVPTESGGTVYRFYDNMTEADLLAADPIPIPADVPPTGLDAPRFIIAKDTRLVLAGSANNPSRLWLSNIGQGEQVNQSALSDANQAGQGGFIDIGNDDGDEIMGLVIRGYEILVFKRQGIWILRGRNEGLSTETWDVNRITDPPMGMVGPNAFCVFPTGILFYNGQAIYELPTGSHTVVELPISRQMQRTFDVIPEALKSSVALIFHPTYDMVLIAMGIPGDVTNTELMTWDRRLFLHIHRRWLPGMFSGRWRNDAMGGQPRTTWRPGLFLWDGTDLFVSRVDAPVVDRLKRLGKDAVIYTDWEQPIPFSLLTPWIAPSPVGKLRLLQLRTEWTYLNDATNDDQLFPGDVPPVLAASVTCRTRPHGAIFSTALNYTDNPLIENPNGLFLSGQVADINRDLPPNLEGTAFQVEVNGRCSGARRVNLLGLWLKYSPRGEYR